MRTGLLIATAAVLAMAACTSDGKPARPSTTAGSSSPTSSPPSTTAPTTVSPTPTATPTRPRLDRAQAALARLSLPERVGQLFMVDCPSDGATDATVAAISRYHVGSVILDGTTTQGVARTAAVTAGVQDLAPAGVQLFVAADQEGGQVQRLRGAGFSDIPSAAVQGSWGAPALQSQAKAWGQQLHDAGVNVDLAPVLDTVPPGGQSNPPIGDLDRAFGTDTATVASHGTAFISGLAAAGVDAAVKHFPGLGRVGANTDFSSGVIDNVTTRHDPYLVPFATAINQRVPFVMVSTAVYTRIDPAHPAAFSPTIVTGMLRRDLHFRGVIITDDVGQAAQLSRYPVAARAVAFVAAGGTIVLTVDATQVPAMTAAVIAQAQRDRGFRAQVDAAALLVLRAKLARGLLH